MRLAFVSDIHGNLPAFEAVLDGVERLGSFDGVYAGGDIALGGLYPAECVRALIDLGWEGVRGNADELLLDRAGAATFAKDDWPPGLENNELLRDMARWTVDRLAADEVAYLCNLSLALTFEGPSGELLTLVHATPWSTFQAVRHDACEADKRDLLDRAAAGALAYGHIHHAYQQRLDNGRICNVGSVGMPYDGDQRACFAKATDDGDGWRFEHIRVGYDHEAYARSLDDSNLPGSEISAQRIRSASFDGV